MFEKPEHGRGGPVHATMHASKESVELNLSLATYEIRWHMVLEWFTCAALFLLLTCRNSSENPQSAVARRSHISTRLAPTPSLQKKQNLSRHWYSTNGPSLNLASLPCRHHDGHADSQRPIIDHPTPPKTDPSHLRHPKP
jgi:hypothetical protein